MTAKAPSERGLSKPFAIIFVSTAAITVALLMFSSPLTRFVRESLMQRVTSAHYEILCPPGALPEGAMKEFAMKREILFTALDKKLRDADSNGEIRIVFDPNFPGPPPSEIGQQLYSVTGTTIRSNPMGKTPQLPAAADAEVLLYVAWGKPGNAQLARWTSFWIVGEWRGAEIGMAAAQVEQKCRTLTLPKGRKLWTRLRWSSIVNGSYGCTHISPECLPCRAIPACR
jgi:hypothetical protein